MGVILGIFVKMCIVQSNSYLGLVSLLVVIIDNNFIYVIFSVFN